MSENKPKTKNEISAKKTIAIAIPNSIPEKEIKLKKLEDGYSIKVAHEYRNKMENGESFSSFSYEAEEHYGKKVKDVNGCFDEKGGYKVNVLFMDE